MITLIIIFVSVQSVKCQEIKKKLAEKKIAKFTEIIFQVLKFTHSVKLI